MEEQRQEAGGHEEGERGFISTRGRRATEEACWSVDKTETASIRLAFYQRGRSQLSYVFADVVGSYHTSAPSPLGRPRTQDRRGYRGSRSVLCGIPVSKRGQEGEERTSSVGIELITARRGRAGASVKVERSGSGRAGRVSGVCRAKRRQATSFRKALRILCRARREGSCRTILPAAVRHVRQTRGASV